MKQILIVSDSRGKLLKPLLSPPPGVTVELEIKNGATLTEARDIVRRKLENTDYTCVYIMAGICSVTSKDEGLVYLPFDTTEEIVSSLTGIIRSTFKELDDLFTTPIILCTFPGAELIKVNNKNAQGRHPQQNLLNEAMIKLNDFIVELNFTRGHSTPMLCSAVHRCHKRNKDGSEKYLHHYCRLDDGIHPTQSTLNFWAKRFQEDFRQFILN